MALTLLFIVDPLDELKAYKDSSVAMMREAARRGHFKYLLKVRNRIYDLLAWKFIENITPFLSVKGLI